MHVEGSIALLAALFANSKRGQSTPAYKSHQFAPHHDEPVVSLDEALKTWG